MDNKELKKEIEKVLEATSIPSRISREEATNRILDLISSEKKSYARGIVGEDEFEMADAKKYDTSDYIRNQLRAEQRQKIDK